MIDPGDIVELLAKDPFQGFRVCMSDGYALEITNPQIAAAMENALFIALPGDDWIVLSYFQMTRLEAAEMQP